MRSNEVFTFAMSKVIFCSILLLVNQEGAGAPIDNKLGAKK